MGLELDEIGRITADEDSENGIDAYRGYEIVDRGADDVYVYVDMFHPGSQDPETPDYAVWADDPPAAEPDDWGTPVRTPFTDTERLDTIVLGTLTAEGYAQQEAQPVLDEVKNEMLTFANCHSTAYVT